MSLKEKYENYLARKAEFEKQHFYYVEKEKELRAKVIEAINSLDTNALTELGFSFELEVDKLEEPTYLMQKVGEIRYIKAQLDERGHKILEGF